LSETHPLNLPPDEIRRLSLLAAMSGAQENGAGVDAMETTPAPEENVPAVNGVNGAEEEQQEQSGEEGPVPPPHRTPTSPSPQPEVPKVDAEACKAAGNKFYKAGQYEKAIEEYSKGL
jgi:DnaJ family protein C protein 7